MNALPHRIALPTPQRVVLGEGAGFAEMVEASVAHGAVTFQLITDEDDQPAQITTMVWPVEKLAEVWAMLGRLL